MPVTAVFNASSYNVSSFRSCPAAAVDAAADGQLPPNLRPPKPLTAETAAPSALDPWPETAAEAGAAAASDSRLPGWSALLPCPLAAVRICTNLTFEASSDVRLSRPAANSPLQPLLPLPACRAANSFSFLAVPLTRCACLFCECRV
eukprot:SAG22_NODE_934_length_6428_cov_3.928267_2_plen_147_part_00